MGKKRTYILPNEEAGIDVEEQDVESFLEAYPDAVEAKAFVAGKDTFDVKLTDIEAFKQEQPSAKELYPAEVVAAPQKKSPGQTSEGVGGGSLPPMPKNEYLDLYVKGTQKIAQKNPGWSEKAWDAYFKKIASDKGFSGQDIDYIKSNVFPEGAPVDQASIDDVVAVQQRVAAGERDALVGKDSTINYKKQAPSAKAINEQKLIQQKQAAENNAKANAITNIIRNPDYAITVGEKDLVDAETYIQYRNENLEQANARFESQFQEELKKAQPLFEQKIQKDPEYIKIQQQIQQQVNAAMQPFFQRGQEMVNANEATPNQVNAELQRKQQEIFSALQEQNKEAIDQVVSKYDLERNNYIRTELGKKLKLEISPDWKVSFDDKPRPNVLTEGAHKFWRGVYNSEAYKNLSQEEKKEYIAKSWKYVEKQLIAKKVKPANILKAKDEFMYMSLDATVKDQENNWSGFAIRDFAESMIPQFEAELKNIDAQLASISTGAEADYQTPEYKRLLEQQKLVLQGYKSLKNVENMPEENMGTFVEGLVSGGLLKALPFVSTGIELDKNINLYSASKKPAEQRTPAENLMLKAAGVENMLEQRVSPNFWYKAGQSVKQSLPYMGEFAVTAGVFNVAKMGTMAAINAGLKKALVKGFEKAVVQQSLVKPFSFLVGAAAQTTANPSAYINRTLERMSPEISFALSDEGSELIATIDNQTKYGPTGYRLGQNEPLTEALPRAWGEVFVDNFTERFGTAVGVYGKGAKELVKKIIPDAGADLMKRFSLAHYLKKKGLEPSKATKHFIKNSIGWDGFGNEFFAEELPAVPLSNLITGDAPLMTGILKEVEGETTLDYENLGLTAVSVGVMSGVIPTVALATTVSKKWSDKGETISFRDENGNPTQVQLSRDNYNALKELSKLDYWQIEEWKKNQLPKLKAEGNERLFLNIYANSLQRETADTRSGKVRERMIERLQEDSAVAALNRIEQQKLTEAAKTDPEVAQMIADADETDDKYITIIDPDNLPLHQQRLMVMDRIKSAKLQAERKGQKGAQGRAELQDLLQQLDDIDDKLNEQRMSVAAAANLQRLNPDEWALITKDKQIYVLDANGLLLPETEQEYIVNEVMPRMAAPAAPTTTTGQVRSAVTLDELMPNLDAETADFLSNDKKGLISHIQTYPSHHLVEWYKDRLQLLESDPVEYLEKQLADQKYFAKEDRSIADKTGAAEDIELANYAENVRVRQAQERLDNLKKQINAIQEQASKQPTAALKGTVPSTPAPVSTPAPAPTPTPTAPVSTDAKADIERRRNLTLKTEKGEPQGFFSKDGNWYYDYIAPDGKRTQFSDPNQDVVLGKINAKYDAELDALDGGASTANLQRMAAPAPAPTPTAPVLQPAQKAVPGGTLKLPDTGRMLVQGPDGDMGIITQDEANEWVFVSETGKETVIPVTDKTSPTESLQELGYSVPEVAGRLAANLKKQLIWDKGMRKIDRITDRVNAKFGDVLDKLNNNQPLTQQEKDDAMSFISKMVSDIEGIETAEVEEKDAYIDMLFSFADDVNAAPIVEKKKPAPVAEAPKPTTRKVYEYEPLPSRTKAQLMRLAKGKAEPEALIQAVKDAYESGVSPKEALAKMGFGKQEYEKAVNELIEALKPTVREEEIKAEAEAIPVIEFKPSKKELVGMIDDGTALDLIKSGQITDLDFMRQLDKANLPLPTWWNQLEETTADEQGYRTEEEDAELLNLINKATERTGLSEAPAPVEAALPALAPKVEAGVVSLEAKTIPELYAEYQEHQEKNTAEIRQEKYPQTKWNEWLKKNNEIVNNLSSKISDALGIDIEIVKNQIQLLPISNNNEARKAYEKLVGKTDGRKAELTFNQLRDLTDVVRKEIKNLVQGAPAQDPAVGNLQYIESNPVGGTAEIGQYRPEFQQNAVIQVGNETKVIMPDGTVYRAVYVLAKVMDDGVLPSHDPKEGFRKTEGYPVDNKGNTTNDRDYEKDTTAQADVMRISQNPNYDLFVDAGQTVSVGPPVITQDGFVVGGNGRTMAIADMARPKTVELNKKIQESESRFGFSDIKATLTGKETITVGKKEVPAVLGPTPRLGVFRMLLDYDVPYSKTASAEFNKSEGKTKSTADVSLTLGANLKASPRTIELLYDRLGQRETMGEFFNNPADIKFVRELLVSNGIIQQKDVNQFFEQNQWTSIGKDLFSKGLFATLFNEDVVRMMRTEGVASFVNKVASNLPTIAKNFSFAEDVNLKSEIEGAIRFQSAFAASGMKDPIDFIRQATMFDKPRFADALMWALIDASTTKNNIFRKAVDSYNNSLDSEQGPSLFEDEVARTKKDFFELITKNIPENERQAIESSLADEGFDQGGYGAAGEDGGSVGKTSPEGGLLGRTSDERIGDQGADIEFESPVEFDVIDFVKALGRAYDPNTGFILGGRGDNVATLRNRYKKFGDIEFRMAKRYEYSTSPFDTYYIYRVNGRPLRLKEYYDNAVKKRRERKIEPEQVKKVETPSITDSNPGRTAKERAYIQIQLQFSDLTAVQQAPMEGQTPLYYRSALQIQGQTPARLAESKLGRALKRGEYIFNTSKITTSKDFNTTSGKTKVKTAADVAYIARFLETEKLEHVVVYIRDKNGNDHFVHLSSGTETSARVNPQQLADTLRSFQAQSFVLVHNHPNGDMRPSPADIKATKAIRKIADSMKLNFMANIIVDTDKGQYTTISKDGEILGEALVYKKDENATDYLPIYQTTPNTTNVSINNAAYNFFKSKEDTVNFVASTLTGYKSGQIPKGGVLFLDNEGRVLGHLLLKGVNDIQTIQNGVAATQATRLATWGTFNEPVIPIGTDVLGAFIYDHIHVRSENFGKYDITSTAPALVVPPAAPDIPHFEELGLPYDKSSTKLQQAVQQAMQQNNLKFEDVMLDLYLNFFKQDKAKMRKAIQETKEAYDEVSLALLSADEGMITQLSDIDEVTGFNLDEFFISITDNSKEEPTLRQVYNDFMSWFEYNYPDKAFYVTIEMDPEKQDAYIKFRFSGDPVRKADGSIFYFQDWLTNNKIQQQWYKEQRSKVFDRPEMITYNQGMIPTPPQRVREGQYNIGEDQALATNLILERFLGQKERGFMLGDGMGIGKTRIELTSANEMVKATGLPVVIVTASPNIVEQIQREADALNLRDIQYRKDPDDLNKPRIIVATYQDITDGKVGGAEKYGAIIFDEAHKLKNTNTKRGKKTNLFLEKTDHVVFATGTPMDKPVQLAYFIRHISNKPMDEALKPFGVTLREGKLIKIPDAPQATFKELLVKWRENLIKNGAYIRREFPFFGTASKVYVSMDELNVNVIEEIKEERPGSVGIMDANRYQEHLKIPYILQETLNAISEGKQVVVFCAGINETEIKSVGVTVPQFALKFAEELKKAGIESAKIFGANQEQKLEESRKFQRGEVKVAIATIQSGGTGIDLDDQFGTAPREVIFATLPFSGTDFDQAKFRVSRRNTKTPSRMRFVFFKNSWVDQHKEDLVDRKIQTLSLIQKGKDPDLIDMEYWNEDAEGNLIDVTDQEYDENGKPVDPIEPGDFVAVVSAEPAPAIETKDEAMEMKEKFDNKDEAVLREVGELPELPPVQMVAPVIAVEGNEVKLGPVQEVAPEKTKKKKGKKKAPTVAPSVPSGPAPSTRSQRTSIGGAVPTPTAPRKRRSRLATILFGPEKLLGLNERVIKIYHLMGAPTPGEYHMMNSRYLGFYEHLPKDVKLKFASNIFTGIHELVHWIDFSVMGGLTNKIISDNNQALINQLKVIYTQFYGAATPNASLETQVAEGLTMYLQMKLYDPSEVSQYNLVRDMIFTSGGVYYHPKFDQLFSEFEKLKNDIKAMSPIERVMLRMGTPVKQTDKYTVTGWNLYQQVLMKLYDESIPLELWDNVSGVGFGGLMERITDPTEPAGVIKLQSAQNAYFMYRLRNQLASNAIAPNASLAARGMGATGRPLYYGTGGKWVEAKYRVQDYIELLDKIEKENPQVFPQTGDAVQVYGGYLIARRMFMEYSKRNDQENEIYDILNQGWPDFRILQSTTDPVLHAQLKAQFVRKYVRPLQLAYAKFKKSNEIIGNEGGSYIKVNPAFSPSLLAWGGAVGNGRLRDSSFTYNPASGNLVSEETVTDTYMNYNSLFQEVDNMYDSINRMYIEMGVATGLIKAQLANEWIQEHQEYPGYAPFYRYVTSTLFEDPEFVGMMGQSNMSKLKSTYQWSGSERSVYNPIHSQMVMIHEVFRKGTKNLIYLRLASQARNNDLLARGFTKLKTVYVPDGKGRLTPTVVGRAPINNEIKVYVNGTVRFYGVNDPALLAFNTALENFVGNNGLAGIVNSRWYRLLTGPANFFALMTTGVYPYWFLSNITVDTMSAWVNSRLGTIPFVSSATSFIPALFRSVSNALGLQLQAYGIFKKVRPNSTPTNQQLKDIAEYIALGGGQTTFVGDLMTADQMEAINNILDRSPKGLVPMAKEVVTKWPGKVIDVAVDLASIPTNVSEIMTRFTEFDNARKKGMSREAALRYSLETMPFIKRGASRAVRLFAPMVAFLKASLVVGGKMIGETKARPKRMAAIFGAVAAGTAYYIMQMWDDMDEWEKNFYKKTPPTMLSMYLVIPARFFGGPNQTMYIFRVPEFIGSAMAWGIMYGIASKENTSVSKKDAAKALATNLPAVVNPVEWYDDPAKQGVRLIPQIVRPPVEIYAGKRTTAGGVTRLVPRYLEFYPSEYQFKIGPAGTNSVGKAISDMTGNKISPIEAEYLITQYGGATASMVMNYTDNKEIKSKFVKAVEDNALRGTWYDYFYEKQAEYKGYYDVINDIRSPRPKADSPEYKQWLMNTQETARAYVAYSATKDLLSIAFRVQDYVKMNGKLMSVEVLNAFDESMEGFYKGKSLDENIESVAKTYLVLKDFAQKSGYIKDNGIQAIKEFAWDTYKIPMQTMAEPAFLKKQYEQ